MILAMTMAKTLLFQILLSPLWVGAAFATQGEEVQDVQALTHQLNLQRLEVEQKHEANLNKKAANTDERRVLEARLKEIDQENTTIARSAEQALQAIQIQVTSALLEKVMLQADQFGSCKVRKGAEADEYIIERKGETIRFQFAVDSLKRKPVARQIKQRELHLTEIEQPSYSPRNHEAEGEMNGKLRFEPETFKVIHAVFRGERINDKAMGWGSSYDVHNLSCVLLDNL